MSMSPRTKRTQLIGLFALSGLLSLNPLSYGQTADVPTEESPVALPANPAQDPTPAEAGPSHKTAAESLNRQLRTERVRLSGEGTLAGHMSTLTGANATGPTAKLTVVLLQGGRVISRAEADADGNFLLSNVNPGVYTLLGAGPSGYLCLGLEAISATNRATVLSDRPPVKVWNVGSQEVRSLVEIDGLAVPPSDFGALGDLIRAQIPPGLVEKELLRQKNPKDLKPRTPREYEPAPDSADEGPADNVALRQHQVRVTTDGQVVGRMRRIHPQSGLPAKVRRMSVFLIQDNRIVSQAPVSETGQFTLKNVTPGFHSFVSAGVDGLAAFGVQVADSSSVADIPAELEIGYVSLEEGNGFGTATGSTDPASTATAAQTATNPSAGPSTGNGGEGQGTAPATSAAPGGGSPPSTGGGGGGTSGVGSSGPGGVGTLLGVGAAVAAGAAIEATRKKTKASP